VFIDVAPGMYTEQKMKKYLIISRDYWCNERRKLKLILSWYLVVLYSAHMCCSEIVEVEDKMVNISSPTRMALWRCTVQMSVEDQLFCLKFVIQLATLW